MEKENLLNNFSPRFSDGAGWKDWMRCYRFGTLVFIPLGKIYSATAELRKRLDPSSAKSSMPHITLTQPFAKCPGPEDLREIKDIIHIFLNFEIQTGPVVSSPGNQLIWVDINPKDNFVRLRDELHKVGLFRTDLPFTTGFTPHMTISEFGKFNDIKAEIEKMNRLYSFESSQALSVKWIIPDDNFIFKEVYSF